MPFLTEDEAAARGLIRRTEALDMADKRTIGVMATIKLVHPGRVDDTDLRPRLLPVCGNLNGTSRIISRVSERNLSEAER